MAKAQTCAVPRMFFFDTHSVLKMRAKDPYVVRFNGQYWMYYSTWLDFDLRITVGVATSDNLVDWNHCASLPLEGACEATGIAAPGAIVKDGKIHLFYQSYGGTNVSAILHAWSSDGTNFIRDESNPISHPIGAWNNSRAIDAEAAHVGTNLFLYSATRDSLGLTQQITLASAPFDSDWSMSNWTQLSVAGPVLAPQIPTALDSAAGISHADIKWEGACIEAPTIAIHGGYYYLFYAGAYNNAPQQIGVAVSTDGINFKRMFKGQPFLKRGAIGTWNYSESGHPGIFQDDDGRDYLFFQGDNAKIGLDWHLSMIPLKWQSGGEGNPDVPVLDEESLSPAPLTEAFQAEDFSERWMRSGGWPCEVVADGEAAAGHALQCVYGTAPRAVPATNSPETRFNVNFKKTGSYYLYARVSVADTAQSFFVASQLGVSSGFCLVGNLASVAPSTNYFWINVSLGTVVDGGQSYATSASTLKPCGKYNVTTAGANIFCVRGADAGVKLDAFVFDQSSDLTSQKLNSLIAKKNNKTVNDSVSDLSVSLNTLTPDEVKAGWRLLWDGKTTEGWRSAWHDSFPVKGWMIHDGMLTVQENGGAESAVGGDIITRKRYSDFELTADFKITPGANSGIKIFVQPALSPIDKFTGAKTAVGSAIGCEFQILDDVRHPDAKLGRNGDRTMGSLYDLITAPKDKKVALMGEWNHVRILSQGKHVEFWLNGQKTVEFERGSEAFRELVSESKYKNIPGFGEWADGHILLQDHGNEASFCNLKIREFHSK